MSRPWGTFFDFFWPVDLPVGTSDWAGPPSASSYAPEVHGKPSGLEIQAQRALRQDKWSGASTDRALQALIEAVPAS